MTTFLYRPTPAEISAGWSLLSGWLQTAIDRDPGRESTADVLRKVLAKQYQLWTAHDGDTRRPVAVAVTSLETYPQSKRLILHLLAGPGRAAWWHLVPELEEWAKAQGCDAMEAAGRKGWGRIAPEWKPVAVLYRRDLKD